MRDRHRTATRLPLNPMNARTILSQQLTEWDRSKLRRESTVFLQASFWFNEGDMNQLLHRFRVPRDPDYRLGFEYGVLVWDYEGRFSKLKSLLGTSMCSKSPSALLSKLYVACHPQCRLWRGSRVRVSRWSSTPTTGPSISLAIWRSSWRSPT